MDADPQPFLPAAYWLNHWFSCIHHVTTPTKHVHVWRCDFNAYKKMLIDTVDERARKSKVWSCLTIIISLDYVDTTWEQTCVSLVKMYRSCFLCQWQSNQKTDLIVCNDIKQLFIRWQAAHLFLWLCCLKKLCQLFLMPILVMFPLE